MSCQPSQFRKLLRVKTASNFGFGRHGVYDDEQHFKGNILQRQSKSQHQLMMSTSYDEKQCRLQYRFIQKNTYKQT
jgi:hypothetical protein